MKAYLVALIITFPFLFEYGQNIPVDVSPLYGYHVKYGIPRATLIKQGEENAENLSKISQRIVGGEVTDISKIPYQVGLIIELNTDERSVCGGSLISKNRVLTAAHCYYDGPDTANIFTVILGSNTLFKGGLRIVTKDVELHPSWDPVTAQNDIAIIRIDDVTFSNTIQPISLPTQETNLVNEKGLASGFGTTDGYPVTSSQLLYSVEVKIISNEECTRSFGPWIRSSIICTSGEGGIGTCGGDSGGPLAITGNSGKILVGLTSFGDENCESAHPSAYTRVTSYLSWVSSVL